ncbi:MAG: hypothetical protein ACXAB4_10445, partial [Candidatus Hodarchaeales archaeon]
MDFNFVYGLMAGIGVGGAIGMIYLGHKRGLPNTSLWAAFPFIQGLQWLLQFLWPDGPFITERLELALAFFASFVLLAAALEFNGIIPRPRGKLTAFLSSIMPLFLLFVLPESLLVSIEDVVLFEGFLLVSDPLRFLYGLLIPLMAALAILGTFFLRNRQINVGLLKHDPILTRTTLNLVLLLIVFSLFMGFDYEGGAIGETVFTALRSVALSFIIIMPLVVILSSDLGIETFLMIQDSGMPLFAYNFKSRTDVMDDKTILTAGFVAAITSFSGELSQETNFYTIRSNRLYYAIVRLQNKIYTMQSMLHSKNLESQFFDTCKQISEL